jgi:hypothetical protein
VSILVIETYIARFHSDPRADSSCTQIESFVSSKHVIHVPVAWLLAVLLTLPTAPAIFALL